MTESRKLRKMKAASHRRLIKSGKVQYDSWTENWFQATDERLDKMVALGLVTVLGDRPKIPKGWYAPRLDMHIEPMAVQVYKLLNKKWENVYDASSRLEKWENVYDASSRLEAEFFETIQKWVDDHSCADAIIGLLELEIEGLSASPIDLMQLRKQN